MLTDSDPCRDATLRKYRTISFGMVDIDVARDVKDYLDIISIPNYLFYVDSKLVNNLTGGFEENLNKGLNDLLKNKSV